MQRQESYNNGDSNRQVAKYDKLVKSTFLLCENAIGVRQ